MPGVMVPAVDRTARARPLIDRLQRAAAIAARSNSCTTDPLRLPAAWAASTTYATRQMVLVAGRYYINVNSAGASGASAPVWPTTGSPVTDGALSWLYAGDAPVTANYARAPTVTAVAATMTPLGAGSVLWYPALFPSVYTVHGADAVTYATNYWSFAQCNRAAGTAVGGQSLRIAMVVEDASFAIGWASGSAPHGVFIDGRAVSAEQLRPQGGSPNWFTFDFSGIVKPRLVEIVSSWAGDVLFAGIATTAQGTVTAPPLPEVSAVLIGDSYAQGSGYGPFRAEGTLPLQLAARLGWAMRPMAQGATGYIASSGNYTYVQRIADVSNAAKIATADVVVLQGSTNDSASSAAAITAAVTATLDAVRAVNRTAIIIGFGPASINAAGGIAAHKANDTAVAAGFAGRDALTFYVPFANASDTPVTGSYLTGIPSGANAQARLIALGDGVHPSDIGTAAIAAWMAERVRRIVIAMRG